MIRRNCFWLACILVLLQCGSAQAQPAAERHWELLAHGSGERLWYAVTTPPNSSSQAVTFIRQRTLPEDWEDLTNFPARLIALGDLRGQLVASLEGGEWKRISEGQFSSGPPLPGRGEILALADQDAALYAIGFAEGARPAAATAPATTPATAPERLGAARSTVRSTGPPSGRSILTSAPTTRPEQLQFYKLAGGAWKHVAELPVEVLASTGHDLSLTILKADAMVAYKDSSGAVRILRLGAGSNHWSPLGVMQPKFAVRKVKLLAAGDHLVGWAVGESGVGSFFFPPAKEGDGGSWREQPLSVTADVPVQDAAVAAAGDELRLLVIRVGDDRERFFEQKYDVSGRPEEKSFAELPAPKNSGDPTAGELVHWGLLALLMVITLATANRGGPVRVVSIDKVELALAPFSLRLAAGLIDLWPVYVGYLVIVHHYHIGVRLSQFYADRFIVWAIVLSLAVYCLHPLIGELIWGRSLGKMFVGLRVVGLDGRRPPMQAIVLRNLMRIVEMIPFFPLVAVIFLNPLRQRVGDFTAGTLVTAKLPVKSEKDAQKESSTV